MLYQSGHCRGHPYGITPVTRFPELAFITSKRGFIVFTTISTPVISIGPRSAPVIACGASQREHVPVMIENRYQALKAEYKPARLGNSEPMVVQCKDAVSG
jgi:hypothetical protein